MAWSGWESLGGTLVAGPASASWAGDRLDAFVTGTDMAVYHKWWDGRWWGWEDVGRVVAGAPAVVSWSAGRIDLFARGADNALWHRWFDGRWRGWESLGGVLTATPAVCSWEPGRLDVFARGTDSAVWHKWFDTRWHGWEPVGGTILGQPAAVSWASGRIDLFARGTDNALWHRWFDDGWSDWESLGGTITSGPAAASWAPGRLDVFARGTDSAVWHKWFDAGWQGWESLGGVIQDSPAAVSWSLGRIDLFVRGSDNAMYHKWFTSQRPTIRLHIKTLATPLNFTIDKMVDNMIDLYASVGIGVHRVSDESLTLPLLADVDVGACTSSSVTAEQAQLLTNRNFAGANDVVVYFVNSTLPVKSGCASHPSDRPAAVIASIASAWTLAHEVGHVLGLGHVVPLNMLMTRGGTANITDPPPDVTLVERMSMELSQYSQDIG